MEVLKEWWFPYAVSNIVGVVLIWAALKKPIWCRMFLAAFFLWASCFNFTTAITNPTIYLTYAKLDALLLYRDFINGFFSKHITVIVCLIAIGQFKIFLGLLLNKIWVKLGIIGGIVFGLAIAPLGVGSGFPTTVSMAVAFFILLNKYHHDFIWKINQYHLQKLSRQYKALSHI
jgi:hypothetical protein